MKIKHLVSTSALIVAGIPTAHADEIYMCKSCPTGEYSTGGSAKSCSPCQAPVAVEGSYAGQCGTVDYKVRKYCQAGGNTSATDNPLDVSATADLGCSGHNYCNAPRNGSCVECKAPTAATWNTSSGCDSSYWTCKAGYYINGDKTDCLACDGGTYKQYAGNNDSSSCKNCGQDKYANAGSTSCSDAKSFSTPNLVAKPNDGQCETGTLYANKVYMVTLKGGDGGKGWRKDPGKGATLVYKFRVPVNATYELCAGQPAKGGQYPEGNPYRYTMITCGGGGAGSWLKLNYNNNDYFFVAGGGGGSNYDWCSGGGGGGIGAGGHAGDEEVASGNKEETAGGSVGSYTTGSSLGCGIYSKNYKGGGGKGYQVNGADGNCGYTRYFSTGSGNDGCMLGFYQKASSGGAGGGGGGGSANTQNSSNSCSTIGQGAPSNKVTIKLYGNSYSGSYTFGGNGGTDQSLATSGTASHASNADDGGYCSNTYGCAAIFSN
ncbi:MAG: hypothetical protein IJ638_03675 [Alphaproteobacteria bacterium]|nr:hypothetical protein [Alphaproteobacteria bacterium]